MTRPPSALLYAALALLLGASEFSAQRSFVGKKLQGTFVDTEGRTIDPRDYEGAVLVMIAGIPW